MIKCPKGHTITTYLHFDLWYCLDCHIAYEDIEVIDDPKLNQEFSSDIE